MTFSFYNDASMDHWLRAQTTQPPQLTLRQKLPLIGGYEVGELAT
jgi:hypothetical protein